METGRPYARLLLRLETITALSAADKQCLSALPLKVVNTRPIGKWSRPASHPNSERLPLQPQGRRGSVPPNHLLFCSG